MCKFAAYFFILMDNYNVKKNSTAEEPLAEDRIDKFPIKAHEIMLKDAFEGADFSLHAVRWMKFGIGFFADVVLGFVSSVHLDNHRGNDTLVKAYKRAIDGFHRASKRRHYIRAGVHLHTIGVFYAHTNFIDLYSLYARQRGLSMEKEDIPEFSKLMDDADFLGFAKTQGELRAGTYGVISDLIEKIFKTKPKEGSHTLMNLDSNESVNGGKPYAPDSYFTKHEAGVYVAYIECRNLLQRFP